MSGPMERYSRLLEQTPGPIPPGKRPGPPIDLKGLMRHAREEGVRVEELPDEVKSRFILAR